MADGMVEVAIEDVEYLGKFADWMDSILRDGDRHVDDTGKEVVEVPVEHIRNAAFFLRVIFVYPPEARPALFPPPDEKSSESAA